MTNPSTADTGAWPQTPSLKKQFLFYMKARATFLKDATPDEQKLMLGHFQHLASLHKSGALVMGGRYLTDPVAVCVVEAPSEEEARRLMEADPSVKAGVLKLEVHPFVMPFLEGRPAPQAGR